MPSIAGSCSDRSNPDPWRSLRSALVAVQAGLPGRTAEPPQQLSYVLSPDGAAGWCIADIIYASEPPFRLSTYLQQLLEDL